MFSDSNVSIGGELLRPRELSLTEKLFSEQYKNISIKIIES